MTRQSTFNIFLSVSELHIHIAIDRDKISFVFHSPFELHLNRLTSKTVQERLWVHRQSLNSTRDTTCKSSRKKQVTPIPWMFFILWKTVNEITAILLDGPIYPVIKIMKLQSELQRYRTFKRRSSDWESEARARSPSLGGALITH